MQRYETQPRLDPKVAQKLYLISDAILAQAIANNGLNIGQGLDSLVHINTQVSLVVYILPTMSTFNKGHNGILIIIHCFAISGVYFSSRVEHVKFVDFCGKYRLPLLQYLCSPRCKDIPAVVSSDSESDAEDMPVVVNKIKRVLLG